MSCFINSRNAKARRQHFSLTAAETGSFLWPSVKIIFNQFALAIIKNTSKGACWHTMSGINEM